MAEPEQKREDLVAELAAKAAVAAGKDAAQKAARGILEGDEKDEAGKRSRKWKLVAGVVAALFLLLGFVGLVLNYWAYFLGAGVLGLAGLYGYFRLRAKLRARGEAKSVAATEPRAIAAAQKARVELPDMARTDEADAETAARERELRRAEAERDARARAEAQAVREQEVDDELAAMKARLGK